MDAYTHMVGGVGLGYATIQVIPIDEKQMFIYYGCCLLGSIISDIDNPKSFISRYIPIIPTLLFNTIGHRTFTHSFKFVVIMFLLVAMTISTIGAVGISIGIISHILLDKLSSLNNTKAQSKGKVR